ncbi:MAG: glutamate synthase, partial [Nitrososphaerales archaeon]
SDMWIAHTRQPTNSPGELPIWSHPFASSECAIVHNGDISSFGANIELLNAWGIRSHVGTDSEVVARLFDHLIRVEGLSIKDAATVLTNPYERDLSNDTLSLLSKFKGARLDGPFAVVSGYCDGEDLYLIALIDRSKFRPLLIGEDENYYYVSSEENQIRGVSRNANIWTPEPGSFFIASLKHGLISSGTTRNPELQSRILRQLPRPVDSGFVFFEAPGKSSMEINSMISRAFVSGTRGIEIRNAAGDRFIGIGISNRIDSQRRDFTIRVSGFPGNCLANLNDGVTFEVFGNASDDVADTMHSGRVVVHGNARDVLGQALQGGDIFVRGCVGNRAAIQMREYKHARPFVIIGETTDDYLGEYMAGGVACVLNLSGSPRPTGNFVGTGMVGGVIYVRGRLANTQIGLLPNRRDVLEYLGAAQIDGLISKEVFHEMENLEFPTESYLKGVLSAQLFGRVKLLFFFSKYTKSLEVEYRALSSSDLELLKPKIAEFFQAFSLDDTLLREVLSSEFTIIRTKEEKVERPVPPQDVPVEE